MLSRGSKPVSNRAVELGEVLRQAVLGVGMQRIDRRDLDDRRRQEALDVAHRRHEALALLRR